MTVKNKKTNKQQKNIKFYTTISTFWQNLWTMRTITGKTKMFNGKISPWISLKLLNILLLDYLKKRLYFSFVLFVFFSDVGTFFKFFIISLIFFSLNARRVFDETFFCTCRRFSPHYKRYFKKSFLIRLYLHG